MGKSEGECKRPLQPSSVQSKLLMKDHNRAICGWPTDMVSIDYYTNHNTEKSRQTSTTKGNASIGLKHGTKSYPHTILLFVPGNPGCIDWYKKMLYNIVLKLGPGYAARGVSYAGHGVSDDVIGTGHVSARTTAREQHEETKTGKRSADRDTRIVWTVDGQAKHKIRWVDGIIHEMSTLRRKCWSDDDDANKSPNEQHPVLPLPPKFVFLSHSIGSHLVQRICVLRNDILDRTLLLIHLMPFIRFDPPFAKKLFLSTIAGSPGPAILFLQLTARIAAMIPTKWLDVYMERIEGVKDEEGRKLAIGLARKKAMARNILELGLEEIREVPERHDDAASRIIAKQCPTTMLFCGSLDPWAPSFHMMDILALQRSGRLPKDIYVQYMDEVTHGFVVHPEMISPVVNFCVKSVLSLTPLGDNCLDLWNTKHDNNVDAEMTKLRCKL